MLNAIPKLNTVFMEYSAEVFQEGALSLKTKALIAVAVSLAVGCGKCAGSHVAAARQLGATDVEIREAIAVAEIVAAGSIRVLAADLDTEDPGPGTRAPARQSCCG